ncbi:MAG: hypothetical protein ABH874_08685 [Methanobacteriota archaeon]
MTKKQLIVKLYKEKFIDGRVLWNLLGSRFKKSEIEQIDETFRKYFKRTREERNPITL